jgi:thiamine pyrophosphokinase
MSSHHVIREKQEPALLVMGMNNFSDEHLGQLLEWSPTVMVTPLMAEKLNAYGIKIDWVIADEGMDELQSDVKVLPIDNKSPLLSALKFLTDNSYPAVNVVTDELNINDYLPFADKINPVIFYNNQKIYPVTSGFSKWKPAGESIELLSPCADLQTSGLNNISATQFTTTHDGLFTLHFSGHFVFAAENL